MSSTKGMSTEARVVEVAAWCGGSFAVWGVMWLLYTRKSAAFAANPVYAAFNFAHMLTIFALCYYSLIGRLDWVTAQPATLNERMYVYDPSAEKICLIQIALQIFATTAALATRDKALLKPELLGHHIVTGTLMCICLHPFGHSRVGIFFGLTELSTIPLTMMDQMKNFKQLSKQYPTVFDLSKVSFAISFLVLRVGLTSQVSYEFQRDLVELYATGAAHSVPALAFMSLANLFVCGLQFFWASLIIKGLVKMASGGKDDKVE